MDAIMRERSRIVKTFSTSQGRMPYPPFTVPRMRTVWHPGSPFPVPVRRLPPYNRLEPEVSMTVAAGFCCRDGVVLAADTEITVGEDDKTYQSKLFLINQEEDCYLAYAGYVEFAKELVSVLQAESAGRSGDELLHTIKGTYRHFWDKYHTKPPEDEKTSAYILVTLRRGHKMYLYYGNGRHFRPVVGEYVAVGVGGNQAESILNPLWSPRTALHEAACIAVYALRKPKGYVQGCGGNTEILSIPDRLVSLTRFTNFEMVPERGPKQIEEDLELFDEVMLPVLLAYPDLDGADPKRFRNLFQRAVRRLERERTVKYRRREQEELKCQRKP